MHFEGTVPIRAPRAAVWAFLTDPQRAGQCAPGLEQLEVKDSDRFVATVRTGVGPVKGRFVFEVTWLEQQPETLARVQARGKVPGSAVDMVAQMSLDDGAEASTTMRWESEVRVSGTIASVGARLLQSVAERTTSQIFECVRQKLETPPS